VLLRFIRQQIPIPRRHRRREQPTPCNPVDKAWSFQTTTIPPQETSNRAFGLRELLRRQIDPVEDEDQLRRRF
jgi:hypothetical protein